LTLTLEVTRFPIAGRFTISRGSKTEAAVVTAIIETYGARGWGECVPYARYGESLESVTAQLDSIRAALGGADLLTIDARHLLPAGAARNALDCALIDWRAKKLGTRAATLLGLEMPQPATTAYTISLGTAAEMRASAMMAAARPVLKIKLGTPDDLDRLKAVREGAPEATLIVDANEGWTPAALERLLPALAAEKVALIEQPLPAGADGALVGLAPPIPICADESMHQSKDVAALADRYQAINIKLDKTGGLTEALAAVRAAQACNLKIMIGCMVGSSLAMAPAVLLTPFADFVDLDGPLLLGADREPHLRYEGSTVFAPESALWG
jgi:L-Ala-D/L-Glu epimerase